MTVAIATGMTMTRRNSGSNIPPFRRAMDRQIRSDSFPAIDDPRIPPTKGAIYNKPIDKEGRSYGLY